eukprot:scaffold219_cov119-Skeletonema_dohrnii-CCMP3373.AAC.12
MPKEPGGREPQSCGVVSAEVLSVYSPISHIKMTALGHTVSRQIRRHHTPRESSVERNLLKLPKMKRN